MLSPNNPAVHFDIGETRLLYIRCPRTGIVEFSCIPISKAGSVANWREFDEGPHITHLPARWQPRHAHEPEWLTPFKSSASPFPNGFTINRSMRINEDLKGLSFEFQTSERTPEGGLRIETSVVSKTGLRLVHVAEWREGAPFFQVSVKAENTAAEAVTLEYLPSFSIGRLSPFHPAEATERLALHRFRAVWSSEGRHEARLLEDLCLEGSWAGFGLRTERFGQIGSMPVRQWFPWAAIEDLDAGVYWGVQLAAPGSWQIEVARLKDRVTLSGGLPSADFGEWWITLAPGETFTTPSATIACVAGDLDALCHALTSAQIPAAGTQPEIEKSMPVVFNEWCSSWGEPTHDYVVQTAKTLAKHRLADILVIDDGWAKKPPGADIQNNGDWEVDTAKFPGGLAAATAEIRSAGLLPGLWFEYEAATEGSDAFNRTELQIARNGRVVQVGTRHFWDLRNPGAVEYLADKVIARLRDDGFGYLKVDYNDCLPAGIDGPFSPGENLRRHLIEVHRFLQRIRSEIPGILIENCSSGGHRLEPSFQALCAMGSFSDAHETVAIPIIAANLHRLILPRQSQIWCVVHADDPIKRLEYGLSACFLGRMCISGAVKDLPEGHLALIAGARAFYKDASGVIRDGRSALLRELSPSWNEPRGWQAVLRHNQNGALVVPHFFHSPPEAPLEVALPEGTWEIVRSFGGQQSVLHGGNLLRIACAGPLTGGGILLRRK